MAAMDEDLLLQRALDGDREAFGGLVEIYQRPLFNVALRMVGNDEDARDLTQTAFVKAYRALGSFDRRYRFFSWIYRILINESLNLLKRRRRSEPLDPEAPSSARSPDDDVHEREVHDIVQAALLELAPAYREVIVLRHFLSQSHQNMAETLGIPPRTVKSRLHTARQLLGKILHKRGVVSV